MCSVLSDGREEPTWHRGKARAAARAAGEGDSASWRHTSTRRRAAGLCWWASTTAARAGPSGAASRARTGCRGGARWRPPPRGSRFGWRGALADLPLITAAFGGGELSYSQVRAMSRVATPEGSGSMLSWLASRPPHSSSAFCAARGSWSGARRRRAHPWRRLSGVRARRRRLAPPARVGSPPRRARW